MEVEKTWRSAGQTHTLIWNAFRMLFCVFGQLHQRSAIMFTQNVSLKALILLYARKSSRKSLSYMNISQFDSQPDSAGIFFCYSRWSALTHHHTLTMSSLSEWVTWIKSRSEKKRGGKKFLNKLMALLFEFVLGFFFAVIQMTLTAISAISGIVRLSFISHSAGYVFGESRHLDGIRNISTKAFQINHKG